MAFAQLTYRESLRDIETCLRALQPKLYHAGIRGLISRSTLAEANENRDWRIYADFAQELIQRARQLYAHEDFGVTLNQTAYAFDSTTVDLCLSLFPWAQFRRHKAAIKIHTLLDLRGNIPCFLRITSGKIHDVRILDELTLEPGSFYIMDRAYIDFRRLYTFTQQSAFFVTRAKSNLDYIRRSYSTCRKKPRASKAIRPLSWSDPRHHLNVPGLSSKDFVLRFREQKTPGILNQQFRASTSDHRPALSMPMAGGTLLQMDQTALTHQGLLWDLRKRHQNSNLDRDQHLCTGGDPEKGTEDKRNLNEILQIISITIFENRPIDQVFSDFCLKSENQHPDNQLVLFNS